MFKNRKRAQPGEKLLPGSGDGSGNVRNERQLSDSQDESHARLALFVTGGTMASLCAHCV